MGDGGTYLINASKVFLPPKEECLKHLAMIWEADHLTTSDAFEYRLGKHIKAYAQLENVRLCANPTVAFFWALRACQVAGGEVVTTPFIDAAAVNAMALAGARPVLADVHCDTLSPTVVSVEKCLTAQTRAILLPHVFGYPAKTEDLEALAVARGIPLIFDATCGFGVIYKNKSLLQYGDISVSSFQATEAFNGTRGGGIFFRDSAWVRRLDDCRPTNFQVNLSTLQAAMALAVWPHRDEIVTYRRKIHDYYGRLLPLGRVRSFPWPEGVERPNYCCYPLLMENEEQLLQFQNNLARRNILAQRCFSPVMDNSSAASQNVCPVARDRVSRIIYLPIYHGLPLSAIQEVGESLSDILLTGSIFADGSGGPGSGEVQNRWSRVAPSFSRSMAAPKLCVLTTAYNHEKYIEECIKSVAAQECEFPIEHIIGEDASSDRTAEIIRDYAVQYKHIRPLIQKERTYGRGNLGALFQAVRSPYVSLCEGDDFFTDPRKLQKQVEALELNPEVAVCAHPVEVLFQETGAREIFPDPKQFSFMTGRSLFGLKELVKVNFIQTNSVVYRWRFSDGIPSWFNYYIMPQDWYWHILHAETGKILYLSDIMSCYRRHKEGLWSSSPSKAAHTLKWAYSTLRFFQVLDQHFHGRWGSVFDIPIFHIYAQLHEQYAQNDHEALEFYKDFFPRAAAVFKTPPTLKLKRRKIKWFLKQFRPAAFGFSILNKS